MSQPHPQFTMLVAQLDQINEALLQQVQTFSSLSQQALQIRSHLLQLKTTAPTASEPTPPNPEPTS